MIAHLYVHIPFCAGKCQYCDFVSFTAPPNRGAYLHGLLKEAALWRRDGGAGPLQTIYFGGGTPSLLTVDEFALLLDGFRDLFGFAPDIEITAEANPDSVDADYLRALRSLGVNRLSLGVQAFQDHLLRAMGRRHDRAAIFRAVAAAEAAGFENISVDLIYGLPGQTQADWRDSLEQACGLPLTHISTYGLKLSDASPWGRRYLAGELALPDDEQNAAMQLLALDLLEEHGFPWYEVANAARPGFACRHNLAYWQRRDYAGLGLSAASLYDNVRFGNTADWAEYLAAMERGAYPPRSTEKLTAADIRAEAIFLPLRLRGGLDLAEFREKFGEDLLSEKKGQMVKIFELGLAEVENTCLKLTKAGIPLHNEVLLALL